MSANAQTTGARSILAIAIAAIVVSVVGVGYVLATTFTHADISIYSPQTRDIVISTVPLVIHEQMTYQPGLKGVFGSGGVLNGREVYGFNPDTIFVYQGDTIKLTVINAQADDEHTFTIDTPFNVNLYLKANSTVTTSFVADKVGVFKYYCSIGEHMPYMYGTLVVLPATAAS